MLNVVTVFLAQYFFITSIGISGVYFLYQSTKTKKEMLLFALMTLPLIGLTAYSANHVYNDPRPFVVEQFTPLIPHAPDNGFPSDHALLTFSIAAICFSFNKRLGLLLGVIALIVGVARVYAGVHHSIDIIGSIVIVVVVATFARLITSRLRAK